MKHLILLAVVLLSVAATAQTQTYKGAAFRVKYPTKFSVQPSYPSAEGNGSSFDAVTFTSPDKKVTFFVFAPAQPQEVPPAGIKLDGSSESSPPDTSGNVTSYYSYYNSKDKHTHSYQVTTTPTGHYSRIVGLSYLTMNDYEKYRKQYLTFKKTITMIND